MKPTTAVIGDWPPGLRIIVNHRGSIIGSNGGSVFAIDGNGTTLWSHSLDAEAVSLRPWGNAILVNDSRRLWLLNPESGAELVPGVNIVASETRVSGKPVFFLESVVLSPNRVYLGLTSATLALDRKLHQVWRVPAAQFPNPVAATDDQLLTYNMVTDSTDLQPGRAHIALRDARYGSRLWYTEYQPGPYLPRGSAGQWPGPPGSTYPPPDERWTWPEGAIGRDCVAIRDAQEIRVFGRSDGRSLWGTASTTPVTSMHVVGDLVLVSAAALNAYNLATGEQRWQQEMPGARIGTNVDGSVIVASSDTAVAALRPDGTLIWRIPAPIAGRRVDAVRVTEDSVYLTYIGTPNSSPSLPDVVALGL